MKRLMLSALLVLAVVNAFAKDFKLDVLPQAEKPQFDLATMKGKTYYDNVHEQIAPAMEEEGKDKSGNNERKLLKGKGVSVKLGENNYNVHINFPTQEMGGRSYGWTNGGVGDWSDAMYLDNLNTVVGYSDEEIKKFYKVIINMLANSDATGLEELKPITQRVATNFLAIYTAEQYRRIQKPTTRWDDALLQVTLLGAFHGGQDVFEMIYTGQFTDRTKKKGSGVYANGKEGVLFNDARLQEAYIEDYHQFSGKTPDQDGATRSGINLTRNDFEKMGAAITSALNKNKNLIKIEKILGIKRGTSKTVNGGKTVIGTVIGWLGFKNASEKMKASGGSTNIFSDLAEAFATGKIDARDAEVLSEAVANFMVDVKDNANKISDSLRTDKSNKTVTVEWKIRSCKKMF